MLLPKLYNLCHTHTQSAQYLQICTTQACLHGSASFQITADDKLQAAKPVQEVDRSIGALKASQAALEAYLGSHQATFPLHTVSQAKQGIVITAGGQRLLVNAIVVVKVPN